MVAGFEPLDVLESIRLLLRQLVEGRCEVENQYTRVVPREGNPKALEVIRLSLKELGILDQVPAASDLYDPAFTQVTF